MGCKCTGVRGKFVYCSERSPVYINSVNVMEQSLTLNFPKSLEDHMTHRNQFQV